jgi:hypothetical protein
MQNTTNVASFGAIEFIGTAVGNGIPVSVAGGGYRTKGGIFSTAAQNNTYNAVFGTVVSVATAAPNDFLIGWVTPQVISGVVLFDPSIAQNEPAKSNYYLKQTPMTVITSGLVRFGTWTAVSTGALAVPLVGGKAIFNNTSGVVEFVAAATTPMAGWQQIVIDGRAAVVQDYDARYGVVVDLG